MSDQRIVEWMVAFVGCVSSDGLLLKVFRWVQDPFRGKN